MDLNRTKIWYFRSNWMKVTPNLVPDSQYKLLFLSLSVPRMACKLIPRVLKKICTVIHSKSNPSVFHIKSLVKCKQFRIKLSESAFGTKKMAIELMWRFKKKVSQIGHRKHLKKLSILLLWKYRFLFCRSLYVFSGIPILSWANSPAKFPSLLSVS